MLIKFDSIAEFMADLPLDNPDREYRNDRADKWVGGLNFGDCVKAVTAGCSDSLKRSDQLLSQVEDAGIELPVAQWEFGVTGPIACVPSFIAGSPESMLYQDHVLSESAPIRVYMDLFLSCGYTADDCATRGATVLALARKLSSIRPVELYILMGARHEKQKDGFLSPMIKVETNPMDLTSTSFVMGHPGFIRHLTFAWHVKHGTRSTIPYFEDVKAKIKPEPTDLFIEGAILFRDILDNPVQWVNDQVKKFVGENNN